MYVCMYMFTCLSFVVNQRFEQTEHLLHSALIKMCSRMQYGFFHFVARDRNVSFQWHSHDLNIWSAQTETLMSVGNHMIRHEAQCGYRHGYLLRQQDGSLLGFLWGL
eukprot:GILK01028664.1.p2 GENE.GILK01028664.1~~GILK01028664.1.p2  ORF type:complete len:107 (+),score=6.41 GILK01028664.1:2-322(+)